MTRESQQLLRDAAAKLCRASAWLDPRRSDADHATEEALTLCQEARLLIESVEISLSVKQAARETTSAEVSR